MKGKKKLILDTELVQIVQEGGEYRMFIKMSRGGTLEHEPFPQDLRGLVAALQLATEVCAGKFFPRGLAELPPANTEERPLIGQATKVLGGRQ